MMVRGVSETALARCTAACETPKRAAAFRVDKPLVRARSPSLIVCRGRPRGLPCATRRAKPARTRSTIRARSNSAIAPSTETTKRPAALAAPTDGRVSAREPIEEPPDFGA